MFDELECVSIVALGDATSLMVVALTYPTDTHS